VAWLADEYRWRNGQALIISHIAGDLIDKNEGTGTYKGRAL